MKNIVWMVWGIILVAMASLTSCQAPTQAVQRYCFESFSDLRAHGDQTNYVKMEIKPKFLKTDTVKGTYKWYDEYL